MSIRQKMNENQGLVALAVGVLVVVAIGVVVWQMFGSRPTFAQGADVFFTVDDGQTWFAGSSEQLPPFEHEGQTAVRAHVYECDGEEFVAYVERYKPEAKQVLVADQQQRAAQQAAGQKSGGMPANLSQIQAARVAGRELKKPGDTEWVSSAEFARAAQITNVACPEGMSGKAEPVAP